jgi:membrane associated rhomboid family serine protease/Zn-finger nucleic acid-binding protein
MLTCPRCDLALGAHRYGPGAIWGCPRCGGSAATLPILRNALARERWRAMQRAVVRATGPSDARCPSCRKPMLGLGVDGVPLDACRRCQLLWFDRGEVPEPETPDLSPEAAEAAARFELGSLERRRADAFSSLTFWQGLCLRCGLPFEIDAEPTTIVPWATIGLGAVLIGIGLFTLGDARWIYRLGFIPSKPFRYAGTTLVTSFFVHANVGHLFGNAYFLAVFGDNVEEAVGRVRFLLLTLAGGIAGAILHGLLDPRSGMPLIGASAGISTLLAYYALRFPRARIGWLWWNLPAWGYFVVWIGFQLLTAAQQAAGVSNVSAFGHIGGAAVGVAFWRGQRRMSPWTSAEKPPS